MASEPRRVRVECSLCMAGEITPAMVDEDGECVECNGTGAITATLADPKVEAKLDRLAAAESRCAALEALAREMAEVIGSATVLTDGCNPTRWDGVSYLVKLSPTLESFAARLAALTTTTEGEG